MEQLRQYAIAVTAAALLCSVMNGLVRSCSAKSLIGMLSGLVLTITMLGPLGQVDLTSWDFGSGVYIREGEFAAAQGEDLALDERRRIIKEELEAYILDKAARLNAELDVEIVLDRQRDIPEAAVLIGPVSSDVRQQLAQMMEMDLGIPLEEQRWTGDT